MMVSDFIALIGRLVHLNITTLIAGVIASIILGAVTHRAASSIQSGVALMVLCLVALLFWLHLWNEVEMMTLLLATVCVVIAGYEGYVRLIHGYR